MEVNRPTLLLVLSPRRRTVSAPAFPAWSRVARRARPRPPSLVPPPGTPSSSTPLGRMRMPAGN